MDFFFEWDCNINAQTLRISLPGDKNNEKKIHLSRRWEEMLNFFFHIFFALIKIFINPWFSPGLQRKLATKRVIKEIKSAYKNVPYYRQKYDEYGVDINAINRLEDIKKIPFITKDEIREQFPDGIVASGINIDKCHYSATTGSTGKSLPFVFNSSTFAFYLATSLRVLMMIGYRPWHKAVYIKYTPVHTPSFGPFFRTAHIPSTISVEEQISMIRKEKPDLIVGYASIIHEIARRVTPDDLTYIRPKFISVNSELSTIMQREFISSVMGCPVYDEYSTEETWMIASQCSHYRYHLFTDNVWVEFLDKDGMDVACNDTGEIVLTTMRSPAMPFIRYRIGDIGQPGDQACTCKMGFPLLNSFEGRSDDSFILPSGKFISSLKILNTFTMYIKEYLYLIEEFKVIQKEKGLIVIQLVKGKEYSKEIFQKLIDRLYDIFNEPVSITLEPVDKIFNEGNIKRKAIESWVNK